jgi:hypothetical protein
LPESLQPRWRKVMRVPGTICQRYTSDLLSPPWIGSIPLVAYYFHIVTPVSTPANLLGCAIVRTCFDEQSLRSLILMEWFPACANLFNHAGWFLMECIRNSSRWFAGWPHGLIFMFHNRVLLRMALYYSLLLVGFSGWLFRPKLRMWLAIAWA